MSDYATNIPQISSGQSQKEVILNRLTDSASPAMLWARKDESCTGLTWAFRGGRYGSTSIADGTVTATASNTNYVVAARSNGAVSISTATTNWNDSTNYFRLYTFTTSGSAVNNDWQDHRDPWSTAASAAVAREWQVAASDETTALTTGTAKFTARAPRAMTITGVRASLTTAQATSGGGGIVTVDINDSGTTILSTKITIDNTEKTSTTAATPAVVSDSAIADDAEITIDIDQIGDGTAKGLKVTILYT